MEVIAALIASSAVPGDGGLTLTDAWPSSFVVRSTPIRITGALIVVMRLEPEEADATFELEFTLFGPNEMTTMPKHLSRRDPIDEGPGVPLYLIANARWAAQVVEGSYHWDVAIDGVFAASVAFAIRLQ